MCLLCKSLMSLLLIGYTLAVEIDILECGVDMDTEVKTGHIPTHVYPWLGILYYSFHGEGGEQRAVTMVALIQEEFVIAAAADIGPMPKKEFRRNSRVLLGHDWKKEGRQVRSYVIHPEYDKTINTIALVQLKEPVRDIWIKPLCPPPDRLINPEFYVVKFNENYEILRKEVIQMGHVPSELCKEFYVRAKLDMARMQPVRVSCLSTLREQGVCVWGAGAAMVTRDVWGRWQLLGVSTRGPGCGAPSRYLDIMSYQPWISHSLDQFRRVSITRLHNQNYVLRAGSAYQRFGACDKEEKVNLLYRDVMKLQTDNRQFQFVTYNMTIHQNIEISCLTLELVNASATSEMRVKHYCSRKGRGEYNACYKFENSRFDVTVYIMFSDSCLFEMAVWGEEKDMTLIDQEQYRQEEGINYEDFSLEPVEYKGPFWMTEFGFQSPDEEMWFPKYDFWTTTEYSNFSTTTEMELHEAPETFAQGNYYFMYEPTTTPWGFWIKTTTSKVEEIVTLKGRKPFHRKSTTTPLPNVTVIPGGFVFPRWG